MAVFAAGLNADIGKVDEEEVGEGVHYLGGVGGRIVILLELSVGGQRNYFGEILQTSSHQLMVEVTGSQ